MASTAKNHFSGGKYTGSYTTVIPVAVTLCEIAHACPEVTKIALGFIKSGLKANGVQSVKIIDDEGHLLLVVKGNTSSQEIHVFVSNIHKAKFAISCGARNNNLRISYRKDAE